MCSNTGGEYGDGGGGNVDNHVSLMKKQKRQRVPKRGPGVAELEKILRQQQSSDNNVVDSSMISNGYNQSPNQFGAHMAAVYGGGGGGSSMVLPEQGGAVFPVMLQKRTCQFSSPDTINLFPHSGPENSSAGVYLHLEPPSYQSHTFVLPDQEKICGTKRSRTFSVDTTSDPPFQFPFSRHFSQLNMPDKSLDRYHSKPGGASGQFRLFGSTPTPLHNQTCSFEEPLERSNQASGVHTKPFFSFLIPEEETAEAETALTLNNSNNSGRMRVESIDLNLKL